MRNRTHSLLAFGLILALLLTPCGRVSAEPQTLDEFMGWDAFDNEAAQEAWNVLERRMEYEVTGCMAARGLGYTPYPGGNERPDPYAGLTDNESKLRDGYIFGILLNEHRWTVEHPDEGQDPESMWGEHTDGIDMDTYMTTVDEYSEKARESIRGEPVFELHESLDEAWAPLESDKERMEADLEKALRSDARVVQPRATGLRVWPRGNMTPPSRTTSWTTSSRCWTTSMSAEA